MKILDRLLYKKVYLETIFRDEEHLKVHYSELKRRRGYKEDWVGRYIRDGGFDVRVRHEYMRSRFSVLMKRLGK